MKKDEHFFHQCVKVLFDFFKWFLNGDVWRKFLYTINTQSAWEVTLYCGVACVLGMVKFTISAQCLNSRFGHNWKKKKKKTIFSQNTFRSNKYSTHCLFYICTIPVSKILLKFQLFRGHIPLWYPPVHASKSLLNVIDQTQIYTSVCQEGQ